MGRMGNFNSSDFKKLQKELEKLKGETEGFQEHCAKKLAQGFITKAVKRTPVGDYRKEITIVAKKDSKITKKAIPTPKKSILRAKWAVRFAVAGSAKLTRKQKVGTVVRT